MDQVICRVPHKKNYEYRKRSNIEDFVGVQVKNVFLMDIACWTILNTAKDNKRGLFCGSEISPVSGRERAGERYLLYVGISPYSLGIESISILK